MASRVEIINSIMRDLANSQTGITDPEITGTLDQIYNRLEFAKKCIQDGVDPNNKKCTVRMVGLYILKCWRITAKPDFNRRLVKSIPKQYRQLLGIFGKIEKLANNTLSYEFKKLKKAEVKVDRIILTLDKLEKNLKSAGENEPDSTKSEFFLTKSNEMRELASCLSDARDLEGSLVSQQEIVDKASNLWQDLEMIDWEEFYNGEDKHPIYVIKDLMRGYPELLEDYMVKKFIPKKKSKKTGGGHKPTMKDKMKEDVIHLDYGKRRKQVQLSKKGKLAGKPSLPEDLLEKAKSRGSITHKGKKVPNKAVKYGPSKKGQQLPPIHRDPEKESPDLKATREKKTRQVEKTVQKAPSPEPVKPVASKVPEKEQVKKTPSLSQPPVKQKPKVKDAVPVSKASVKEKSKAKETVPVSKAPEKEKAKEKEIPKKKEEVRRTPESVIREKKTVAPASQKPAKESVKFRSVQKSIPEKKEDKKPERIKKQPSTMAKPASTTKKQEDVFDIEGLKLKTPEIRHIEREKEPVLPKQTRRDEAEETQILPPGTISSLIGDHADETQILPGGFPPPPKLGGKTKRRTWLGEAVGSGVKPTPAVIPVKMNDDLDEADELDEEIDDSSREHEDKKGEGDESDVFPGMHKETDLPPPEYSDEEKEKLISQMEDTGTMAKKKGCLPFIVGIGSFMILVLYAIFKLV